MNNYAGGVHMQNMLSALREVIINSQINSNQLKQHEPTPNEYFAVIVKTIGLGGSSSKEIYDMLNILDGIIPLCSKQLINDQFKSLSIVLVKMHKATMKAATSQSTNVTDEMQMFMYQLIKVLSVLLITHQDHFYDESFWSSTHSLQIVNMFLSILEDTILVNSHANAKLHKLVQNQIINLLKIHNKYKVTSLFSYLHEYSVTIFRHATKSDYKRSLYLLFFLESTLCYFPSSMIFSLMDSILKLQLCEQSIVNINIFRTLDANFQNLIFTSSLKSMQLIDSIQMLISMKPRTIDMETNAYYCSCLANSVVLIYRDDTSAANTECHINKLCDTVQSLICQCVDILIDQCRMEFTQIHIAATNGLKRIINNCFDHAFILQQSSFASNSTSTIASENHKINIGDLMKKNNEKSKKRSTMTSIASFSGIDRVLTSLSQLLHFKFKASWISSLDVIRCLFDKFKVMNNATNKATNIMPMLKKFVVTIGDLYQSVETRLLEMDTERSSLIHNLLGVALKSCGVSQFLDTISFTIPSITPAFQGIDTSRVWLINTLAMHLKSMPCRLNDFIVSILPIARICNQTVLTPKKYNISTDAAILKQIRSYVIQLWSLFPIFCECEVPVDLSETFPTLSKTLQGVLNDTNYPEIHSYVYVGLNHISKNIEEKYRSIFVSLQKYKSSQRNSNNNAQTEIDANNQFISTFPIEVQIIRQSSEQFVPIFLMRLENMKMADKDYSILLKCLSTWSALAPNSLVTMCGKNLLKLLLNTTSDITSSRLNKTKKSQYEKIASSKSKKGLNVSNIIITNQTDEANESNNDTDMIEESENEETNDETPDHIHIMSDIAAGWVSLMQSIIPYLPNTLIALIYKTIKPLLSVHESILLQKRAYHVLESIIMAHPDLLNNASNSTLSASKLDSLVDIYKIITVNFSSCHVSARNIRLRCIDVLIQHMSIDELNAVVPLGDFDSENTGNFTTVVDSLLSEILLCLKDSNKKSRDTSMKILKFIIHHVSTKKILMMLSSAVLSSNQVVRVGGITSVSVLYLEIFHTKKAIENNNDDDHNDKNFDNIRNENIEFYLEAHQLLLDQVIPVLNTICEFLRNEIIEQTRAVLSFVRVCVNVLPQELLHNICSTLVATFTNEVGYLKNKFTSRIRAILRKLIKRIGAEAVKENVPDTFMPLFDYLQRQSRRTYRKKNPHLSVKKSLLEKMLGSDSENDDESENDDDDDHSCANDIKSRASKTSKVSRITGVTSKSSRRGDNMTFEDHRLKRVKAKRPTDYKSTLPATLDDLINQSDTRHNTLHRKHSTSGDDENNISRNRTSKKRSYQEHYNEDEVDEEKFSNRKLISTHITEPYTITSSILDADEKYMVTVNEETGKVVIKECQTTVSHKPNQSPSGTTLAAGTDSLDRDASTLVTKVTNNNHALSSAYSHSHLSFKQKQRLEQSIHKKPRLKEPGEEYRSKKSGVRGDVWKKGMLQPHAYIPLDPKLFAKKNHQTALGQFSVVKNKNRFQNSKNKSSFVVSNLNQTKNSSANGNRNQRKSSRAHSSS